MASKYEVMMEERLERTHKWDQRQCSFCGNNNTQFVCWRCFEETVEELQNRVDWLEKKVKELDEKVEV